MSRVLALTGGTKDVNPQWAVITVTQAAADVTITGSIPVPINRLGGGSASNVVIIELLRIYWHFSDLPTINIATEQISEIRGTLSTSNNGAVNIPYGDPIVINAAQMRRIGAFTALGSYLDSVPTIPIEQDMTDGAGHGMLIATDSIFLQTQSTTTSLTNSCTCRFLYRFKKVSLAEYIGIVQSQQ